MSDFVLPPFTVEMQMVTLSETMDWSLSLYGIPDAWKRCRGKGQVISVLDTGVDKRHYERGDLKDSVVTARDFTGSRAGFFDLNGHGTHTAGTIGARQDDNGVVGVAPESSLIIGKVLGDSGSGSSQSIYDGILWSVDNNATIISMSLGSSYPDSLMLSAIKEAVSRGCHVICAAGNEGKIPGENTVGYPARWEECVSVGAVDENGKVASFSSRGPEVDICGPGVNILSTYRDGGYAKLSGTSMATPFVSGVVALLLSTGVKLSPRALLEMLRRTAKTWQPGEDGDGSGIGLIDPGALLIPKPIPPPVVAPSPIDNSVSVGPFRVSVETIGSRSGLFISVG